MRRVVDVVRSAIASPVIVAPINQAGRAVDHAGRWRFFRWLSRWRPAFVINTAVRQTMLQAINAAFIVGATAHPDTMSSRIILTDISGYLSLVVLAFGFLMLALDWILNDEMGGLFKPNTPYRSRRVTRIMAWLGDRFLWLKIHQFLWFYTLGLGWFLMIPKAIALPPLAIWAAVMLAMAVVPSVRASMKQRACPGTGPWLSESEQRRWDRK